MASYLFSGFPSQFLAPIFWLIWPWEKSTAAGARCLAGLARHLRALAAACHQCGHGTGGARGGEKHQRGKHGGFLMQNHNVERVLWMILYQEFGRSVDGYTAILFVFLFRSQISMFFFFECSCQALTRTVIMFARSFKRWLRTQRLFCEELASKQ